MTDVKIFFMKTIAKWMNVNTHLHSLIGVVNEVLLFTVRERHFAERDWRFKLRLTNDSRFYGDA